MFRLSLLQQWAEAQGLELAAECHLVRLSQAAQLIRADKSTADQVITMIMMTQLHIVTLLQVANLSSVCCNLNSLQISRLLSLCQDCPEVKSIIFPNHVTCDMFRTWSR